MDACDNESFRRKLSKREKKDKKKKEKKEKLKVIQFINISLTNIILRKD